MSLSNSITFARFSYEIGSEIVLQFDGAFAKCIRQRALDFLRFPYESDIPEAVSSPRTEALSNSLIVLVPGLIVKESDPMREV